MRVTAPLSDCGRRNILKTNLTKRRFKAPKRSSCALCKPHKRGWDDKKTPGERRSSTRRSSGNTDSPDKVRFGEGAESPSSPRDESVRRRTGNTRGPPVLSRKSRRNFANLAIFPTDHRQSALAKFDAFFSRGATMGLGCNAGPFGHILFGDWLQHCRFRTLAGRLFVSLS